MPRYISSQQNRIYAAREASYGMVPAISSASLLPAVKFAITDRTLRPSRQDKTGTRTEINVPGPLRHSIRYQLQTYLTDTPSIESSPTAALVEAALGHAMLTQPAPLAAVSDRTLTFASPHGLLRGAAVATLSELRFVEELISPTVVRLNAPLLATSGSSLRPAVSMAPAASLSSISLFDYWTPASAIQRVLSGAGVDLFRFSVNGDLHQLRFEGPAAALIDNTAFQQGAGGLQSFPPEPAPPAQRCHPVPGHLGQAWIGNSPTRLFTLISAEFTLENNLDTRHFEFGSLTPRALVPGQRTVSLNFEIYCEDDDSVRELFRSAKRDLTVSVFLQLGQKAGEMFGAYIPELTVDVPHFDDSEARLVWQFKNGRATGVADDEVFLAMA